jgi:hypothetical protein
MVVDRIKNNYLDYLTSFINISLFSGELCFNGLCAVTQSAPYAICGTHLRNRNEKDLS